MAAGHPSHPSDPLGNPKMGHKWDIFLSYSRADTARASAIVHDLTEEGFTIWQDVGNVLHGDRIRESINDGIRNSSAFLILLSPRSLRSRWVLNELDAAMLREITAGEKIVIPILLGKIRPSQIPEDLQGKLFVDLRFNFAPKYQLEREKLILTLRLITNPRTTNASTVLNMSDEFPAFLASYKYIGRNETSPLPAEAMEALAEWIITSALAIEKFKHSAEKFVAEFGLYMARKLTLVVMDHSPFSWTHGFTLKDVYRITAEVVVIMLSISLSSRFVKASNGVLDIKIGLEDSRISLWVAPRRDRR